MTPEGKIVAQIRKYLEKQNFFVVNFITTSLPGFPDMVAVAQNGKHYYFEVKTKEGRISDVQAYILHLLHSHNCSAYVVRSVDEVKSIIEGKPNGKYNK